MLIQALNPTTRTNLDSVRKEMQRRKGRPVIRVLPNPTAYGLFNAVEGSHRLAAACQLKRQVRIVELPLTATFDENNVDVNGMWEYLSGLGADDPDAFSGVDFFGWLAWFAATRSSSGMGSVYRWNRETQLLRKVRHAP